MTKTDIYNLKNEKVGTVELPEGVFGVTWKAEVVKQALDAQVANRREPWAAVKDRSQVRGGGRKPWRQKGTGRARHGSTRSPIWVGGGKSHGPTPDRDYHVKLNKKVRRAAIAMVLSKKFADGELMVIDAMRMEAPKTKVFAAALRGLLSMTKQKKNFDILVVPGTEDMGVSRAGRNLPKSKISNPASLNVYDLLNYKHLVIGQGAMDAIAKQYATK
jgi:large subunit ribosomal protein L4